MRFENCRSYVGASRSCPRKGAGRLSDSSFAKVVVLNVLIAAAPPTYAVGMENLTPAPILIAPDPTHGHRGTGTVTIVDRKERTITVRHGPVRSLRWGERTTTFMVKDDVPIEQVTPDEKIAFEFSAEDRGRYVIVKLERLAK